MKEKRAETLERLEAELAENRVATPQKKRRKVDEEKNDDDDETRDDASNEEEEDGEPQKVSMGHLMRALAAEWRELVSRI